MTKQQVKALIIIYAVIALILASFFIYSKLEIKGVGQQDILATDVENQGYIVYNDKIYRKYYGPWLFEPQAMQDMGGYLWKPYHGFAIKYEAYRMYGDNADDPMFICTAEYDDKYVVEDFQMPTYLQATCSTCEVHKGLSDDWNIINFTTADGTLVKLGLQDLVDLSTGYDYNKELPDVRIGGMKFISSEYPWLYYFIGIYKYEGKYYLHLPNISDETKDYCPIVNEQLIEYCNQITKDD